MRILVRESTLLHIRNIILDKSITSEDAILLSSYDFDSLVLEHRETYKEAITVPFNYLGVLIEESKEVKMGEGKIVKRNSLTSRVIIADLEIDEENKYRGATFERCGWCGKLLDVKGKPLEGKENEERIRIIQLYDKVIKVQMTTGNCCRDRLYQQ